MKRVMARVQVSRLLQGIVAVAAMALVGALPAQAETTFERVKREKLITFGFANEPPYTIAALENVTGQDPEVLKAIMKGFGVEHFNGVLAEFSGMIPGLVAKRFDVISAGMVIRPARCKQVAFGNPSVVVQQGLAVKKGNPLKIHSLKDIAANPKARIGILQGSVQYEYLDIAGVK
jgi:polar amino acid transport system substrate-binding protein